MLKRTEPFTALKYDDRTDIDKASKDGKDVFEKLLKQVL